YEFRPSQIAYAKAVRQAIAEKRVALLEAQTGTGKTLAYLIPALESRRRILISTGTKALQEQLFFKDIPLLRDQLGLQFDYILMKGRMNYLCLLKYERLQTEPLLPDEESVEQFEEIHEWVDKTETGDIAESGVPESSPLWRALTIPSDSCQGAKCRHYDRCFVFRIKQRAEKAQVLVVNHHLFFADLSLQVQSGASIFPAYDVVIFDEAHQLTDVATHNLSVQFSQEGFRELYDDLIRELKILRIREKLELRAAEDYARRLGEALAALFEKFRALPQKVRYESRMIAKITGGDSSGVDRLFVSLAEELIKHLDRTEDLPQVARRLLTAQSSLAFLLRGDDPAYVYWAEHNDYREWTLRASPLDVSNLLKQSLWPNLHSAILTSATLFIDRSAAAVKQDLGLQEALEETFPYNFDYPSQACLYVPKHLPEPTDPRFPEAAAEEIAQLVEITGGGAFVLCTSWSNLKVYEQALRELEYPLLVQGRKSKQALMKSFLRNRGSVLLA
ncbi:MAG TPA: ATP-dependent DNA helicase, partial [Acidobacteriota bacterium]|nr:ATP-dependent DNA helicase [Acidobacteriota bacterium]